jgi:hypothetical protein
LIRFKISNAASKSETNSYNTNQETENPDKVNYPCNAEKKKSKSISFKLSDAELEQTKINAKPRWQAA